MSWAAMDGHGTGSPSNRSMLLAIDVWIVPERPPQWPRWTKSPSYEILQIRSNIERQWVVLRQGLTEEISDRESSVVGANDTEAVLVLCIEAEVPDIDPWTVSEEPQRQRRQRQGLRRWFL